jgi:hypothetical protein
MTSANINNVDENVARDLYLFFELACKRCLSTWEPPNPLDGLSAEPSAWADRFSTKFAGMAQSSGWGSIEGDVLCSECLAKASAT